MVGVGAGGARLDRALSRPEPASSNARPKASARSGAWSSELPRLAERAERLSAEIDRMGERGIRLDPDTVAEIGRSEAHAARWGRVALWVIAVVAVAAGLRMVF